jgi:hypothetical protein
LMFGFTVHIDPSVPTTGPSPRDIVSKVIIGAPWVLFAGGPPQCRRQLVHHRLLSVHSHELARRRCAHGAGHVWRLGAAAHGAALCLLVFALEVRKATLRRCVARLGRVGDWQGGGGVKPFRATLRSRGKKK